LGTISTSQQLYLDLLKRVLIRYGFETATVPYENERRGRRQVLAAARAVLRRIDVDIHGPNPVDLEKRLEGRDWPAQAETMIGLRRLDNLQDCIVDVLARGVPGDLIETGAWRGGATIFMRGALAALGDTNRCVLVADSFEGLPRPDEVRYPADAGDEHFTFDELAVSLEEVKANFERYGFLDERVKFLKGWFKDTLPGAPIDQLAILRLDGDLYESTMDALVALYPKLSVGGYVIVDDYGYVDACRAAVEDYRRANGITDEVIPIDWTGVYWKRGGDPKPDRQSL
jgi:O-methyltransferase